jgi:hypothetical protein
MDELGARWRGVPRHNDEVEALGFGARITASRTEVAGSR